MHDLSYFRANLDDVARRLAARGFELNVAEFRDLDGRRRAAVSADSIDASIDARIAGSTRSNTAAI